MEMSLWLQRSTYRGVSSERWWARLERTDREPVLVPLMRGQAFAFAGESVRVDVLGEPEPGGTTSIVSDDTTLFPSGRSSRAPASGGVRGWIERQRLGGGTWTRASRMIA
jgi:hypothetical protein